MKLTDLLKGASPIHITGPVEGVEVDNISYDTRTVNENSIFVCIKGVNTDRHDFIDQVKGKNCKVIVTSRLSDTETPYKNTIVFVEDTNKALAVISANFYGHPEKKMKMIGVTGTNGKTTTTMLVKSVLEHCGHKVGLIGTNDIVVGSQAFPSANTTPEAPDLYRWLSKMEKAGCEYAVMEVSSHSIALERIYGIEFEVGAFTNLTQDHLDFHKTMRNYANTKGRLFEQCKISVINADDEWTPLILHYVKRELIIYGVKCLGLKRAINVAHTGSGVSYDLLEENKTNSEASRITHIDFPIPGSFSVYNSLCACSICEALGLEPEKIAEALKEFKTVKGRCEVVPIDKPYMVIIDYAHTPDGMENILTAVNEFKKGRIITVFGCGGDRDKTKRPQMGAIGKKYSDITILTSDNPRSEDMQSIIDDIQAGIEDNTNVYTEPDRKKAIKLAMSLAQKDDIVLLLGKGHETVQKFKGYEIEFDERKIVRELCDLV